MVLQLLKLASTSALYLFLHGVNRQIPDNETLALLGLNSEPTRLVSLDELQHLRPGAPIESMHLAVITPDSVIHQEAIRLEAFQGLDLLENVKTIYNVWNPSIERWGGKYFVSSRVVLGDTLMFGWINETVNGEVDEKFCEFEYLGIGPGLTHLPFERNFSTNVGDARFLVLGSSTILVTFTATPVPHHPSRVGVLVLQVNKSKIDLMDEYLLDPSWQRDAEKNYHKNWAPFIYNGSEVLWAESLDPLVVVSVKEGDHNLWRKTEIVSTSKQHNHWSQWGSMRGGTPGKKISKSRYLFFFHSRKILPNNLRTTYFFGAFLCSAHPPFAMTHISRSPIFLPELYDGPWDAIKFFDYALYPMSFFFSNSTIEEMLPTIDCDHQCLFRHNVTLVLGWQDRSSVLSKVNLGKLFSTMVKL